MNTTTHNSSITVRGLGQVDKLMPLESIYAGRRTWFPDFK